MQSMSQKLTKFEVDLGTSSFYSDSFNQNQNPASPRLDLSFRQSQERDKVLKQEVMAANRKVSSLEHELKGNREHLEGLKTSLKNYEEKEKVLKEENFICEVFKQERFSLLTPLLFHVFISLSSLLLRSFLYLT